MDSNAGERVKILIIGPAHAGKTAIANFIAERSEVLNPNYHPTAATRIVEFEKLGPKNPRRPGQDQVLVELWDVSGDAKYDRCWPAIQKGTHGIILAYNADNPRQEDEMEVWVRNFPKKMGIPASVCIGFAHHPNGKPIKNKSKPPKGMASLQIYDTSIEEGTTTIHPAFDKFFAQLTTMMYERQEKEETKLMQGSQAQAGGF